MQFSVENEFDLLCGFKLGFEVFFPMSDVLRP